MTISDFQVNVTHKGRYFFATITEGPGFYNNVASTTVLLQDMYGQLVHLSVYNITPNPQRNAPKIFFLGRHICIYEPFFKQMQDGSLGLRVDDPTEIIDYPHDHFSPMHQLSDGKNNCVSGDGISYAMSWKELGNAFYSLGAKDKKSALHALFCYNRALFYPKSDDSENKPRIELIEKGLSRTNIDDLDGIGMINFNSLLVLSVLLTNAALCCSKLGESLNALRYSALATALDKSNQKARLRFLFTLSEINIPTALREIHVFLKDEGENISLEIKKQCNTLVNQLEKKKGCTDQQLKQSWCVVDKRILDPSAETVWSFSNVEDKVCWKDYRKEGKAYFAEKKYLDAKISFLQAAYVIGCSSKNNECSMFQELTKIFSNISAVAVLVNMNSNSKNDQQSALEHSTLAGMLNPTFFKARIRQAKSLCELKQQEESEEILQIYLDMLTLADNEKAARNNHDVGFPPSCKWILGTEYFQERAQQRRLVQMTLVEMKTTSEHEAKVIPVSLKSTKDQLNERKKMEKSGMTEREGKYMTAEQLESMSMIWKMVPKKKMEKMLCKSPGGNFIKLCLKNSVPQFHIEFPKECGWPEGIHNDTMHVLYNAYAHACNYPQQDVMHLLVDSENSKKSTRGLKAAIMNDRRSPANIIKRFHGALGLNWMHDQEQLGVKFTPGTLIDWRRKMNPPPVIQYTHMIRSNFANSPNKPQTLHFGSTHVAVGNNDLGLLLASMENVLPPSTNDQIGKPLRFVGVDSSPFSVAKTLVVAQMLSDDSIPLSEILQAWYSSSWTHTTVRSWKTSVRKVLESKSTQDVHVESFLHHWIAAKPCSLSDARKQWFDAHHEESNSSPKASLFISSLRRKVDRHAACSYILTGDVFDRTKTNDVGEVGSLSMWSVPENSPPPEQDIVFNVIWIEELIKESTKKAKNEDTDILQLLVQKIIRCLGLLRDGLLKGNIVIELYCDIVSADNADLINKIATMRPWSMSWSNCIDYFSTYETFHAIARACSRYGDTIHVAYSMNWTSEVYGTCLVDYPLEAEPAVLEMLAAPEIRFARHAMKYDKFFVYPPHDNIMNITQNLFSMSYYKVWTDYFFEAAKLGTGSAQRRVLSSETGSFFSEKEASERFQITGQNCGLNIAEIAHEGPINPLQRTPSTSVTMTWSYDPAVQFNVYQA